MPKEPFIRTERGTSMGRRASQEITSSDLNEILAKAEWPHLVSNVIEIEAVRGSQELDVSRQEDEELAPLTPEELSDRSVRFQQGVLMLLSHSIQIIDFRVCKKRFLLDSYLAKSISLKQTLNRFQSPIKIVNFYSKLFYFLPIMGSDP
jgi:hypothetical protein